MLKSVKCLLQTELKRLGPSLRRSSLVSRGLVWLQKGNANIKTFSHTSCRGPVRAGGKEGSGLLVFRHHPTSHGEPRASEKGCALNNATEGTKRQMSPRKREGGCRVPSDSVPPLQTLLEALEEWTGRADEQHCQEPSLPTSWRTQRKAW